MTKTEEYLDSRPIYIRRAFEDISATAHWCKEWFLSNHIPFTARDIVSMTQMVIDRQWEVENNGKMTRFRQEDDDPS